jgi:peptidoglycan/xylan/chitin deacetylase (PgdA/CDA1 family)
MRTLGLAVAFGAALALSSAQAAPPAVQLSVTPPAFSPNGDGLKDKVRVHVAVDQPGDLTVLVRQGGQTVATLGTRTFIQPGTASFPWMGLKGDGQPFPDGTYTVKAKLKIAEVPTQTAMAPVLLDTTPPAVSPPHISPVKLRHGALTVRARVLDLMASVRLRLLLYGVDGKRMSAGTRVVVPTGEARLRWHSVGQRLPGAYRVAISASDGLGNVSVSKQRPLLVEHAVHTRIWARFRGVGRHIALTFDDCNFVGAWSSILHTLHRSHIHATFFCPGQRVLAEPGLARKTLAAGHAVGSHGWDHANFPTLSYGAQFWRLERDRDTWWRVARAAATPMFRPPYGAYNRSTIAAAGKAGYAATVLWDVDPRDWSSPGVSAIISRVVGGTRAGSIVLMHVVPETAAALPTIISRLKARHFKPVTLPQLARMGRPSPGGWPHGGGH